MTTPDKQHWLAMAEEWHSMGFELNMWTSLFAAFGMFNDEDPYAAVRKILHSKRKHSTLPVGSIGRLLWERDVLRDAAEHAANVLGDPKCRCGICKCPGCQHEKAEASATLHDVLKQI